MPPFIPKWDYAKIGLRRLTGPGQTESAVGKSIFETEYRAIINALREARKAAGLTQQDVADRLDKPQSYVAKIEGYERRLDVVEFLQLCRAIGVRPASFF